MPRPAVRFEAPRLLKDLAFPARGHLRRIQIEERGWLSALVPDDEVFGLAREIALQRLYEIDAALPEGTVIDAGAHVGLFSLVASRHAARVIAIEPDPVNFRILEINCRMNDADNVETVNAALWIEEGTVPFASSWHSTGGGIHREGELETPSVTLDRLVEEHGRIALLKLDIEGAERRVIPHSACLDQVSRIVAELHLAAEGDEAEMVTALGDAGFDVELIPASELYRARWVPAVLKNWRRLKGNLRIKLGLIAYLLLPVRKPRRPPGSRDMPVLIARSRAD